MLYKFNIFFIKIKTFNINNKINSINVHYYYRFYYYMLLLYFIIISYYYYSFFIIYYYLLFKTFTNKINKNVFNILSISII